MFCKNCGKELSSDEKFCSGCGQKQVEEAAKEEVVKPKTTKKATPPPAIEKTAVQTKKTEENVEKEVVAEKALQVENKEQTPVVNEPITPVKIEETEEKSALLNQSGVAEETVAKAEEKKGFVAKAISKLTRFVKSILPGKKEGISPKEQKRNRIIAAILGVLLIFSRVGDNSSSLTIVSDNQQGALINLTLDEFSEKFNKSMVSVSKEVDEGLAEYLGENFDISDYWSNLVEPIVEYETVTGKQYTMYSAFLSAPIFVSVMDGYVRGVDISIQDADFDSVTVFSIIAIMTCGDLGYSEAEKIYDEANSDDAIMNNQWIYKDGILYGCSTSKMCFCIMPATQEFIDGAGDGFNYEIW